jgi:uncharacterized membrane protein
MQLRSAARIAVIAAAGVAYVAGSHWLMTQTEASAWNVVGVLTPMLVVIAIGAWRSGHAWVGAAAVLGIVALCVQALMGVRVSSHGLYLAQHVGINGFLGIVFGSTLRAGHTPLITALATRVHGGRLTPAHQAYTRKITQAWVIFFASLVAASLALYALASFDVWAVFANWATPVAIGAMFVGEHLIRYRLHPEFERASIADAVRAYMHGPQGNSAP